MSMLPCNHLEHCQDCNMQVMASSTRSELIAAHNTDMARMQTVIDDLRARIEELTDLTKKKSEGYLPNS